MTPISVPMDLLAQIHDRLEAPFVAGSSVLVGCIVIVSAALNLVAQLPDQPTSEAWIAGAETVDLASATDNVR